MKYQHGYRVIYSPMDDTGYPAFEQGKVFSVEEVRAGLSMKAFPNGLLLHRGSSRYEVFCGVLLDIRRNKFIYLKKEWMEVE